LSIVGKRTLKYLQDLEKRQLEAKMSIASDVGRRRYETSREQFLNASTMFLMLAANLYTKEIYLDSKERICYNCKKTANITWKYCKFCGSELGNVFLPLKVIGSKLRLCPECGTTVEGEKNTCPKCGANLNKLGVDVGEISKNIEDIIKRIDAEVETLNARKVIERENAESIENEIRSLEEERKRLKDELEELKGHQEFEEEKIEYAVESGFLVVSTEELRVPHLYIAETLSKVKALCKQLKIEIDDGAQKSLISETISLERDVHEMMMKVVDSIPLALQEFDSFVINGNSLRCESCGTNNTKDASFCVGCGIAIRTRM
jgi:RNA polymerase subunit RPABC4/transcription elongation factor Spt4